MTINISATAQVLSTLDNKRAGLSAEVERLSAELAARTKELLNTEAAMNALICEAADKIRGSSYRPVLRRVA